MKIDDNLAIHELRALSSYARAYIEHHVGNGLMQIQRAAREGDIEAVETAIERIMQPMIAAGFWPIRKQRQGDGKEEIK